MLQKYFISLLFIFIFISCNKEKEAVKEVNIYTHRHYKADKMLFKEFTKRTGIKVNVVSAKADQLLQKLEMEGKDSPADLLITVDAGRLYRAKQKGVLQKISSEKINKNVPKEFRDKEGMWYGLTIRARIIAYAKDRINPTELSTYDALVQDKWNGSILVRSSENIYNQSLLASFIHNKGEEKAKTWTQGILYNMARSPKGNDRDQMKSIVSGKGDLAIINSYYVGKLLGSDKPDEKEVGEKIAVFFPDQKDNGTHINISGIGVTKYAPNKENAIKLLEFLTDNYAQKIFSEANYEYPVKPGVEWADLLKRWGNFKADTTDFEKLGEYNSKAVKIFDEVGWK